MRQEFRVKWAPEQGDVLGFCYATTQHKKLRRLMEGSQIYRQAKLQAAVARRLERDGFHFDHAEAGELVYVKLG